MQQQQQHKQGDLAEHLTEIYPNIYNQEDNKHVTRYENLLSRFSKFYGEEPEFFCRVPAQIQLFGVNYSESGYGNITFCTEQDVVIAYSRNQIKEILINNTVQNKYPTKKIPADYGQKFYEDDEYSNLILEGFKAAFDSIQDQKQKEQQYGLKMVIDCNFLSKRGLGQSNAHAMAMTLLTIQSFKLKLNLMQISTNLLRFKTILNPTIKFAYKEPSLLIAQQNQLVHLDEKTLNQQLLKIPGKYTFIIADSLTNDPVLMTQGKRKDLRECEVRIAVKLLIMKLNIEKGEKLKNLFEIQKLLDYQLEDMIELLKKQIEDRSYSRDELETLFGQPLGTVLKDIPYVEKVLGVNIEFYPFKRAYYILEENIRVKQIVSLLNDQQIDGETKWNQVAQLMNESYKSLKSNLQCSSKQIDILRDLMLQLGCKGVKLMGEGWDGLLIGLVEEGKSDTVVDFTMKEYYLNPQSKDLMVTDDLNLYIYKTSPSRGATILNPAYEIWFC